MIDPVVVQRPDPKVLDPRRWWDVILRIVPRALAPSAAKLRTRAPRRKGRLAQGFDVRARRVDQGLIQGVEADIGARVKHGHLVAKGHRIIARGPTRRMVSITTVRISKRTGRQRVSKRFGLDPEAREKLKARRAAGAIGFVPGHPFEDEVMREDRAQQIRLIEKLLAQEVLR